MKECSRCRESKDLWEFHKKLDGKCSACADCRNAACRAKRPYRGSRVIEPWQVVTAGRKGCKACLDDLPVSEFFASPQCRTGLDSICKECKRARAAVLRESPKRRARINRLARESRARNKTLRSPRVYVPNGPIRESAERWVAINGTWSALAEKCGLMTKNEPDVIWLKRLLGIKGWTSGGSSSKSQSMTTGNAVMVVRAMNQYPADYDL